MRARGGIVLFVACGIAAAAPACDDDSQSSASPPTVPTSPPPLVDSGSEAEAGPGGLTSAEDFHVPGAQIGGVPTLLSANVCQGCHMVGDPDASPAPYNTWSASLMSIGGRDPLFFAQLATANQDAPGVGTYCLRCHVPAAIPSGHAADPTGASLTSTDLEGITCHLCHSMIDPTYVPGFSPAEDAPTLLALKEVPTTYGNAQFVLDPQGLRRGPYTDAKPMHAAIYSPFMKSAKLCGTCHDVGNPEVSRLPDGTYRYNTPYERAPNADPHAQFPLERTFTEWQLSAFASGGVDMGGRFGGAGASVVSSCQDCHMPRDVGKGCAFVDVRSDLARHDFAGASAWVLEIAALANPTELDPNAMARGRANATSMLQRAADLEVTKNGAALHVRVTNQSGHKLPTGHIEGRRVWVNVVFFDSAHLKLGEMGGWDPSTGAVDEGTTTVFEMRIGLSADAAKATGLLPGETTHMSLADVIVKDNRIPPRGFANVVFSAVGAPVVGATYADGQHWADLDFTIPADAVSATVTLEYETVTPDYVNALVLGNHTNSAGVDLKSLWLLTNRDPPIAMAQTTLSW